MKPRPSALWIAIALLLPSAPVLFAETILVYVEQYTNGEAVAEAVVAAEGILDGLFQSEHIVFDTGDTTVPDMDWATGGSRQLLSIAIEGGARIIVAARMDSTVTEEEGKPASIRTQVIYHVMDTLTFATLQTRVLRDDNTGREDEVDEASLIFGLGDTIALDVSDICDRLSR